MITKRICTVNKEEGTIACPKGTNASNAAYIKTKISNLPDLVFDRRELTCNTLTTNINQKCYVDIFKNGQNINWAHPNASQTISGPIGQLLNDLNVVVYFFSGDVEAVFKLPTIKFIAKDFEIQKYGSPTKEKIKDKIYRYTVEIEPTEQLYLSPLYINNAHQRPKLYWSYNSPISRSKTDLMLTPIIANSSLIVGYDIYNDDNFIPWHARTYKNYTFMELSIHPLTKFKVSCIIMEVETKSYRDTLEKWHLAFSDIYDKHGIGISYWFTWDYELMYKQDELLKSCLVNAFWGYYMLEKEPPPRIKAFRYYSPSMINNQWVKNDENIEENLRKCPNETCKMALEYGIRDIDGKLRYYDNGTTGSSCFFLISTEKKKQYQEEMKKLMDKYKFTGIAFDGFGRYDASYTDKEMPLDIYPYKILDDKNNNAEFYSLYNGALDLLKSFKQYAPNGFWINAGTTPPNVVQHIALTGSERYFNKNEFTHSRDGLWNHRFSLGSRPMTILDLSYGNQYVESAFCYCAAVGCVPSVDHYDKSQTIWYNETIRKQMTAYFDVWKPIYEEMHNDTTFMANANGQVDGGNYTDEWGSFCKKNGYCYVAFVPSEKNKEYRVKVEGHPKLYYKSNAVTYEINGNEITFKSSEDFRSLIIKYDNINYSNNKKGIIAGSVIGVVVIIIVITAVVFIILKKKKENQSDAAVEHMQIV